MSNEAMSRSDYELLISDLQNKHDLTNKQIEYKQTQIANREAQIETLEKQNGILRKAYETEKAENNRKTQHIFALKGELDIAKGNTLSVDKIITAGISETIDMRNRIAALEKKIYEKKDAPERGDFPTPALMDYLQDMFSRYVNQIDSAQIAPRKINDVTFSCRRFLLWMKTPRKNKS